MADNEVNEIIGNPWQPTPEDTRVAGEALVNLRERLDNDLNEATCNAILYAKRGRHLRDRFRKIEMSANLGNDFKENFDTSLRQLLVDAQNDGGLRPYAFDEHIEGTLSYMPLRAFAAVRDYHSEVPSDTWEEAFDPGEEGFLAKLKSVFISFQFLDPRERLLIVQASSQNRILRRGFGAVLINNRYERLTLSDTLNFNADIDFIIWKDHVFLKRLDKFESLLNFREHTKAIARAAFEGLVAFLPEGDQQRVLDLLLKRTRHTKKLAKLSQVDYWAALTMDKIRTQIADHELPMRVEEIDGEEKVVLNDPNDQGVVMELLYLLDDDLWRSTLTDRRYAARAKDRR